MRTGYGTAAFRRLEGQIRAEMNPMVRCPSCEEPGYPVIVAWPERVQEKIDKYRMNVTGKCYRRWGLCVLCGHKWVIYESSKKMGGPPPAFSEAERDRIEELYVEAGWLPPQIAKMMHCHPGTIRSILKARGHKLKHGGSKPFQHLSHEQFETMKFLRGRLGWTYEQIGNYMGMHRTGVGLYCRKLGIKRFSVERIQKEVDMKKLEAKERNSNPNRTILKITHSTIPVVAYPTIVGNDD